MTEYKVSNAKITFTDEVRPVEKAGVGGTARIAIIETTDLLKAEVSIQEYSDGETLIRLTEFLGDAPPKYSHLTSNGAMTVQKGPDGEWMGILRALRPKGKDYPTLNYISQTELDSLLGEDAQKWLEGLGFRFDLWASINPAAGKFKDHWAVSIDESKSHLLVLPWALTRVIALMKSLGKPGLEVQ